MKRFRWSLQCLLDVKRQRELAQRAELLRLSREMARTRQEIARRRRVIRASLRELARQALETRIPQQEVVMTCSAGREKEIERLQGQLRELESQRKEQAAQLVRLKKARETLERMRAEAERIDMRLQLKLEQKELDEGAHVSFVRRSVRERTAEGPMGS